MLPFFPLRVRASSYLFSLNNAIPNILYACVRIYPIPGQLKVQSFSMHTAIPLRNRRHLFKEIHHSRPGLDEYFKIALAICSYDPSYFCSVKRSVSDTYLPCAIYLFSPINTFRDVCQCTGLHTNQTMRHSGNFRQFSKVHSQIFYFRHLRIFRCRWF